MEMLADGKQDGFAITIKPNKPEVQPITIKVRPTYQVEYIKDIIFARTGIAPQDQTLFKQDCDIIPLKDDHQDLQAYRVNAETETLMLAVKETQSKPKV